MAADFLDEDFIREDVNDYDIIIIGAGLAGLTCAYNILRKEIGLDVLIIEANTMRNLRNISVLWFFVMLHGASGLLNRLKAMIGDGNRYFIHGGMIKITRKLLKYILRQQGEIRYVEPVSKISFNDYRAYVSTEKNHFRCEFVVLAIPPSMQNRIIIEPSGCAISNETLYTPAENVFFNIVYEQSMWSDNSVEDILTTWEPNNNLNIIYDATHGNQKKVVFAGYLDEPNLVQTQKQGLFETLSDCYKTDDFLKYLQYKEYDQSLMDDEVKVGCPMSALKPTSIDNHVNCTGKSYGRCETS
ncbi:unnamed protein product [Xylocopa violacea]|uniref:monoamine oxidase n=1 Tax=Xylocopa violacea TaxID=135666 RepID=A0ABP1PDR4_XYLVO